MPGARDTADTKQIAGAMRVIALEEHFLAPAMAEGLAGGPFTETLRGKLEDLGRVGWRTWTREGSITR
jgi:hypothetical protein